MLRAAVKEYILPNKLKHEVAREELAQEFADGIYDAYSEKLDRDDVDALQYFRNQKTNAGSEYFWELASIIIENSLWPKYETGENCIGVTSQLITLIVQAFYEDYEKEAKPKWVRHMRDRIVEYCNGNPTAVKQVKVVVRNGGNMEIVLVYESYDVALFYSDGDGGSKDIKNWLEQELRSALIKA